MAGPASFDRAASGSPYSLGQGDHSQDGYAEDPVGRGVEEIS